MIVGAVGNILSGRFAPVGMPCPHQFSVCALNDSLERLEYYRREVKHLYLSPRNMELWNIIRDAGEFTSCDCNVSISDWIGTDGWLLASHCVLIARFCAHRKDQPNEQHVPQAVD